MREPLSRFIWIISSRIRQFAGKFRPGVVAGFFTLFFFAPDALSAQDAEQKVNGTVRDTAGDPIPYVNVGISSEGVGTSSDEEGRFSLHPLPAGTYHIQFSKLGYEKLEKEVELKEGEKLELEIRLTEGGIEFQTVSVTGSASPKDPLRIPDEIDVLEGREMTERSSASLGETVEGSPGVDNVSTGAPFGKPVIRGMSGNRIRLLHNGIPMEHQQYGVRHMPNVDPFLSERIEVLQGPSSVLYGSDALGGVVNSIPHRIPDTRNDSFVFGGSVLGSYHSNDRQWGSGLRLQGGSNGIGMDASFVRRSGGNMRTPQVETFPETGEEGDPKFSGELDHTDFDQYNGSLAAGYQGKGWELTGRYTHWENSHNFLLPDGQGLGQALKNRVFELNGKLRLSEKWELEPSITHMINRRRSNHGGETRDEIEPDEPTDLDIELANHVDRLVASHSSIRGFTGKAGIEYTNLDQTTQVDGAHEALVPSARIENYGVFLLEEYSIGGLDIVGAVRYDHRRQRAEPNEELALPEEGAGEDEKVLKQRYDAVSASIGGNYAFTDRFSVAMTAGRGFRAPSLFDLHAEGVHGGIAAYQRGNPYLEPEYSLNTDLSLKYRSKKLEARATVYRNRIRDYIFMRNIGQPEDREGPPILASDQGNAVLTGAHGFVHLELLKQLHLKADFQVVQGENRTTGEELPLMPPSRAGGELRYIIPTRGKLKSAYLKAGARHTFAKEAAGRFEPFWQFENLPQFGFGVASTDPYTLFHVGAGTDLRLWDKAITIDVEVRNLTNEAYRDFLDTYKGYALGMGRNVRVKAVIPF